MPILFFLGIILSGFVASHMKGDDKTRFFIVLVILLIIIILPKACSGNL